MNDCGRMRTTHFKHKYLYICKIAVKKINSNQEEATGNHILVLARCLNHIGVRIFLSNYSNEDAFFFFSFRVFLFSFIKRRKCLKRQQLTLGPRHLVLISLKFYLDEGKIGYTQTYEHAYLHLHTFSLYKHPFI